MEFEGHQILTIDKCWVFDLTTFIGYHATIENNKVKSYRSAFIVDRDSSTGALTFNKYMNIPVPIMRKVTNIIRGYYKEALLENAN